MKGKLLADFVAKHGQAEAARLLNISQSAVSQMLSNGREIYIQRNSEGGLTAKEVKTLGGIAK